MQYRSVISVCRRCPSAGVAAILVACGWATASCTLQNESTRTTTDGSVTPPPNPDGPAGDRSVVDGRTSPPPPKDASPADLPVPSDGTEPDQPVAGRDAGPVAGDAAPPAEDARAPADIQADRPPRGSTPMVIPAEAWSRDMNEAGYKDGVPYGGFGAGTITWRYDGAFCKDRLDTDVRGGTIDVNSAFYLYEKCGGATATWKKLNAWGITGTGQAKYYALYPKAWFDYGSVTGFTSKAKVAAWSPVIPNDYRRSSYPLVMFEWEISNPSAAACDVALMFTWKNDLAGASAEAVTGDKIAGIKLKRSGTGNASSKSDVEFTVAAGLVGDATSSYQSAATVAALETEFGPDGTLANTAGNQGLGALAVKMQAPANGRIRFPMVLAWDEPIVQIGSTSWYREYTRHFGRTGLRSADIATEALSNHAAWGDAIDAWHAEILGNSKYPAWLRTSMLNELYYYIIGGTVWEAGAAGGQADDPDEDMFSTIECFDYPTYGTSDVRFYGSWPLALYWPNIDKQEVKQFCDSVTTTRSDRPRPLGTTAHDFGSSRKNVFTQWNAYTYRDSTQWKDLNSKLVLMVYRDWALTGKTDKEFLDYCWPAIEMAMNKTKSQDTDGDMLPNSNGIDQTYDNMSLTGNTAYCGSLFIAAAQAAEEIAKAMGKNDQAATYKSWAERGKESFERKLWTGSYYRIDTAGGTNGDRIMADQLAGQWYAKACGLPGIVPADRAASAFKVIYDNNFKKFDNGRHGVVNVLFANGGADRSNEQTQEVWIGTAWGVVAGMIQEGLATQASEIGQSLYNTIWNEGQFWFRTPEAIGTGLGHVRALYYMRTNSVWAVKHAYDITP